MNLSTCLLCTEDKFKDEIIKLQCNHLFCLVCLEKYTLEKLGATIKCPEKYCNELITDYQIRNILPDKSVIDYETLMIDKLTSTYVFSVHNCLLPECNFMVEYDTKNTQYDCPNCLLFNCISCKAAHKNMSCDQFLELSVTKAENICNKEIKEAHEILSKRKQDESRQSILEATMIDLLLNQEVFECFLCCLCIIKGNGVRLRNCFHLVCRKCLIRYINNISKFPPKCPHAYCSFSIEDREIKKILSEEEYTFYVKKSLNRIKPQLQNRFQCKTPDCEFFCELKDDKVLKVKCLKCKAMNCVPCKAIHKNESCKKYALRIQSTDIGKNNDIIEDLIKEGKCMKCPECQNLVQKTRGCNWIQCTYCGIELCWALKIRRWGPGGRGDTSGGCKCMVNGVPCHQDCSGCIPHGEGFSCPVM